MEKYNKNGSFDCYVCDNCEQEYTCTGVDVDCGYNSFNDERYFNFCNEDCCIEFFQKQKDERRDPA